MPSKSCSAAIVLTLALSACATNIENRDETIQPSTVPFGKFATVVLRPLAVEHSGGDSGDANAVTRLNQELRTCMASTIPAIRYDAGTAPPATRPQTVLLVEPSIVDIKKVNTSERIFLGPLAGSSAALLKMKYTDMATGQVLAEPIFYAKANAWGGAFTFGTTDNLIMRRLPKQACDYTKRNL